jgi:DNA (cytosine-5)-methyltransferase 1
MNMVARGFDLDNRITVVLFAGMGGGCDGLEWAGFPVHVAINHDPIAVAVHKARHPHTRHLQCDVFEADPYEVCAGRGVRVLHASPDCTHFSVAKGSKPVSKRRRSLAWVICRWAGTVRPETITMENVQEIQTWGPLIAKRDKETGRVLKLDGTVAAKGERVPVQEQWLVPDPRHKGRIWRAWLKHLTGLGYSFDCRVLVCADYGVPTIRKRFFGVAQADGRPIVWRERTHAPRKLARKLKLKPRVGAYTIIDWLRPVKSIFDREKPHAEATRRRIARGVVRYVVQAAKPFLVPITHAGDRRGAERVHDSRDPLRALTTAHRGELAVVGASLIRTDQQSAAKRNGVNDPEEPLNTLHTSSGMAVAAAHLTKFNQNGDGTMPTEPLGTVMAGAPRHAVVSATIVGVGGRAAQSGPRGMEDPLGSTTTKEDRVLVAASLVQTGYGEREGQAPRALDIEEPAGTQMAGGGKAALVAAFLAQHNNDSRRVGGVHPGREPVEPVATLTVTPQVGVVAATLGEMRGQSVARDPREPAAAMTSGGGHAHLILAFLQTYYGSGDNNHDCRDPLHTVTVKERHGLVIVKVNGQEHYIDDIGMRMLEPEEGAAAHGFQKGCLDHEITVWDERKGRMVTRKLTKTEKYHLVGNSVPPFMVQMLAEDNVRRELALEAAE